MESSTLKVSAGLILICLINYVAKIEADVSLMAGFGFVYLALTLMEAAAAAVVVVMARVGLIFIEKVEFLSDVAMVSL